MVKNMIQHNDNTYMIYTRKGRGYGKIVGPIFHREIQKYTEEYFPDIKTVHVVLEETFKSFAPKAYTEYIKENWMDKMYCYLIQNNSWIGECMVYYQQQGFSSSWFNMNYDERGFIAIYPEINANPFHIAKLLVDISRAFPMLKVRQMVCYYKGNDGKAYLGDKAAQRALAEYMINNSCFS